MAVIDYEYKTDSYPVEVKEGIDYLYDLADKKEAVDDWVSCFSKTAVVWKNDSANKGHDEIRKYMNGTWNNTESRVHYVLAVDVLQESPLKLSITGKTTYVRSNGDDEKGEWTAEQTYVLEDRLQKIDEYKIKFAFVKD